MANGLPGTHPDLTGDDGLLLSAIWRQMASVSELVRVIRDDAVLWEEPKPLSQQALSQRFNILPATLFLHVLNQLLSLMQERW